MRKITKIILHCTATPEGRDVSANTIRGWHKAQGWSDIGYHYVIRLNGTIEQGRAIATAGAHCNGHNAYSIGIVYVGGLTKNGKAAKDTRTPEQKAALINLVAELMERYNLPMSAIHCHNEYAAKACPSFTRDTFIKEFNDLKI